MAVAGMLALSSCTNDDNEQTPQNAPRQMTFTAGFGDGATTRATLNGSTKAVTFDAGDKIGIFSTHNNNVQFTTTAGTTAGSASFSGTATAGDATYYAIYPYDAGHYYDSTDGIGNVDIPSNQNDAATSTCGWDPAAPIAYANTTDATLTFYNACALLKVTNGKGNGTLINIHVDEDRLTGNFYLNPTSGVLTPDFGSEYVEVSDVPDGKTIYLAVAPGTYTNFIASWLDASLDIGLKGKASVTFAAGKIYDLGNTSAWPKEEFFNIDTEPIWYGAGETWAQAITFHKNNKYAGWEIVGDYVHNSDAGKYLYKQNGENWDKVGKDDVVSPTATYKLDD